MEAKKRFRQTRSSICVYCGTWIKCDMYRHVAKFHLDLAQLWRCPVSWCTAWKGTPHDCMDHIWGAHDVPWVDKSASIEQFVPPFPLHVRGIRERLSRTSCLRWMVLRLRMLLRRERSFFRRFVLRLGASSILIWRRPFSRSPSCR